MHYLRAKGAAVRPEPLLLDAPHIVADEHERLSHPVVVPNGISIHSPSRIKDRAETPNASLKGLRVYLAVGLRASCHQTLDSDILAPRALQVRLSGGLR
jgi:hypothetical protein